jgi:hypothetical protein
VAQVEGEEVGAPAVGQAAADLLPVAGPVHGQVEVAGRVEGAAEAGVPRASPVEGPLGAHGAHEVAQVGNPLAPGPFP